MQSQKVNKVGTEEATMEAARELMEQPENMVGGLAELETVGKAGEVTD